MAARKTTAKKAPVKKKPVVRKKKAPVKKAVVKKKEKPEEVRLNQSQLAFRFKLTREIVARRLNAAGVSFEEKGSSHEKLYYLEEARPFLETDENINELKKRKLLAEAVEKEIKVDTLQGSLLSASEVTEVVQVIFSNLHRDISIRMVKSVAGKLKNAKTIKDVNAILKPAIAGVFDRLRNNHEEFLKK